MGHVALLGTKHAGTALLVTLGVSAHGALLLAPGDAKTCFVVVFLLCLVLCLVFVFLIVGRQEDVAAHVYLDLDVIEEGDGVPLALLGCLLCGGLELPTSFLQLCTVLTHRCRRRCLFGGAVHGLLGAVRRRRYRL